METVTRFASNVVSDVTNNAPKIAMDAAYGTALVIALDMTPFGDLVGSVSGSLTSDPTRQQQLNAGMTYATISSLHRAFNASMGGSY